MSVPVPISDRAGLGTLWATIRALTNDFMDATNRGDTHEAKCLERRLNQARQKAHALYNVKIPVHDK